MEVWIETRKVIEILRQFLLLMFDCSLHRVVQLCRIVQNRLVRKVSSVEDYKVDWGYRD